MSASQPFSASVRPEGLPERVEIYDTTLRDGTQSLGVSLSLTDKLKITRLLDELGIDFLEGGYPLSNPKDAAYFEEVRRLPLQHTKLCAFGMTRRRGTAAAEDAGMRALLEAGTPVVTIVGKSWDLHVDEVLRVSRDENLDMIAESLRHCRQAGREVFFDAEHFFDGYRANPEYSLQALRAAVDGGATRLILCDTNGGGLPGTIAQAVGEVRAALGSAVALGIHCHNDGGLAVANTLAAIAAGAVQAQGTINGIGERCGNVDLLSVIANLRLKLGVQCLADPQALTRLTEVSRFVYQLANLSPVHGQPFVGAAAFAHKGGMHVHAVNRLARSYEHIPPEAVGNTRQILVSELSGASNIAATLGAKFGLEDDRELQRRVLQRVQDYEHQGYVFEAAPAALELILRAERGERRPYWRLERYRCVVEKLDDQPPITQAHVRIAVASSTEEHSAHGDGPVNALDIALRRCLAAHYPDVANLHLRDYKVRVIDGSEETAARVRVIIDFAVQDEAGRDVREFSTVGVSENIVDASWEALIDAFEYHLIEAAVPAPA